MPILNAIQKGCDNIKELCIRDLEDIAGYPTIMDDEMIAAVCKFESKLTSLELVWYNLKLDQLKTIVDSLSQVTSLQLHDLCINDITESMYAYEVISICANIPKLKIYSPFKSLDRDLDVIERFANFTRNNKYKQVTLVSTFDKIVSARGEVRKNNQYIYWIGCDASYNQSELNLLDLIGNPLKKIIGLLDESSQTALYNTCKKAQTAVGNFISERKFHIRGRLFGFKLNDDALSSFGKHIRSMSVALSLQFWRHINRNCTDLAEICNNT